MSESNANVSHLERFPCPLCGQMLKQGTAECTNCDWVTGYRHRKPLTSGTSNDFTAVALSVIPGLGHVFKGHITLALSYMAGTLVILFFIGVAGMVAMGFQLLLLPFYWVWTMAHAFLVEDRNPKAPTTADWLKTPSRFSR